MSKTDSVSLPYEEIAAAMEAAQAPGDLTDQLIATSEWSDQMLAEAGIPVVDVPIVSVGGGSARSCWPTTCARRACPPPASRPSGRSTTRGTPTST